MSMGAPAVIRLLEKTKMSNVKIRFNRRNLYVRDNGECAYCLTKIHYRFATMDHVVPKSKGGKTTWNNIVVACVTCNRLKENKRPEDVGLKLHKLPRQPEPVSAIKAFYSVYKSRAPSKWLNWIDNA